MEFQDRVALITGGTGALGADVSLDLIKSGARVAVTYRSEAEKNSLERRAGDQRDRLWSASVDLTLDEEIKRCADEVRARWGRLDFLVCVAGGFAAGKSYVTDDQTWQRMLDVNLRSLYLTLRAVVPIMIQQNFGRIVTISSGAILNGGGPGIAAYAVSKAAVRQLSEILASELKAYDIRVHCVMPGTMDTDANRRAMPDADFSKWVKTQEVARVIHCLLGADFGGVRSVVVPVLG